MRPAAFTPRATTTICSPARAFPASNPQTSTHGTLKTGPAAATERLPWPASPRKRPPTASSLSLSRACRTTPLCKSESQTKPLAETAACVTVLALPTPRTPMAPAFTLSQTC
eukprot:TRINITY_DN782_c0_g1_i1.p5 TRINITY_DN782_c0_g1~~TRINITY_DN782_c0_g1_i1.p5  ORF type:complete len:112 (-),score=0.98 TRINITY_DN782_c0_g1_i1:1492-1827(-)